MTKNFVETRVLIFNSRVALRVIYFYKNYILIYLFILVQIVENETDKLQVSGRFLRNLF